MAALARGDTPAAIGHLEAAHELFEALGMHHLALEPLAGQACAALAGGDLPAALAIVDTILAAQAAGISLDGTEEPMRLHLICHQVLAAAADPRAQQVLADARCQLLERAARISDPARRNSYLNDVPYHREIVAAWRANAAAAASVTAAAAHGFTGS